MLGRRSGARTSTGGRHTRFGIGLVSVLGRGTMRRRKQLLVLRQAPGLPQLRSCGCGLLLVMGIEIDGLDAQAPAHDVEQLAASASRCAGAGQQADVFQSPRPGSIHRETHRDLEKVQLLQVRVGDPPSALQVVVQPVAEHVPKRFRRSAPAASRVRVGRVVVTSRCRCSGPAGSGRRRSAPCRLVADGGQQGTA